MLTYNTQLPSQPPVSPTARASVLAAMTAKSPYTAYGQSHQDAMDRLGSINAETYASAADRANDEYDAAQRQAQQQLALAGLQQMAQAQQNKNDLGNNRLQQMTGFASSLLGGLFR